MISQQKTGFSASPFMKGFDKWAGAIQTTSRISLEILSDHRADPQVKRQRIPHANYDVILRCFQDALVEINVVFHASIEISVLNRRAHSSYLVQQVGCMALGRPYAKRDSRCRSHWLGKQASALPPRQVRAKMQAPASVSSAHRAMNRYPRS